MSQSTLERDTDHLHEEPPRGGFLRSLIRILAMSLAVTAVIAGLYIAFAGMPGSDEADTTDTAAAGPATPSGAAPAAADTAADKASDKAEDKAEDKAADADKPAAPEPPTFTETYRAAVADLPEGALSDKQKEKALKGYIKDIDLSVTSASKPGQAATESCRLLAGGTTPKEMIQGLVDGGAFTKEQSKAFLYGATTLYCSGEARAFR